MRDNGSSKASSEKEKKRTEARIAVTAAAATRVGLF
jgi:hypothetical protein